MENYKNHIIYEKFFHCVTTEKFPVLKSSSAQAQVSWILSQIRLTETSDITKYFILTQVIYDNFHKNLVINTFLQPFDT
jgi:hypothetical protein